MGTSSATVPVAYVQDEATLDAFRKAGLAHWAVRPGGLKTTPRATVASAFTDCESMTATLGS
ncbi:hypothetical protein ACFVTT_12835 [Streptomyces niveus]|uniref:hypothetical protein n=1 Tax=Streptomyces niveus TaxID=193462 RepID=UPI00342CBDA4